MPSKKTPDTTYGDQLRSRVMDTVRSILPSKMEAEKSTKPRKTTETSTPSTREAAKQELIQQLSSVERRISADREKEGAKSDGKSGAVAGDGKGGGKGSGTGKGDGAGDGKSEDDGAESHRKAKVKKKPFGSKKNIHTIDCFRDESTKEVKNIGARDNIVGFHD